MENAAKRTELNKELTTARRALLAVGIIMFVMDMIFLHLVWKDRLLPADRNMLTAVSAGVLVVFVVLWYLTPRHPRICLGAGLVVFWLIQIINMVEDPKSIGQGILIKIFFTVALVKGFKSANRVEVLRKELENVFE